MSNLLDAGVGIDAESISSDGLPCTVCPVVEMGPCNVVMGGIIARASVASDKEPRRDEASVASPLEAGEGTLAMGMGHLWLVAVRRLLCRKCTGARN